MPNSVTSRMMILLSGLMSCKPTESWSRRIYVLYVSSGAALQGFVLVETESKVLKIHEI